MSSNKTESPVQSHRNILYRIRIISTRFRIFIFFFFPSTLTKEISKIYRIEGIELRRNYSHCWKNNWRNRVVKSKKISSRPSFVEKEGSNTNENIQIFHGRLKFQTRFRRYIDIILIDINSSLSTQKAERWLVNVQSFKYLSAVKNTQRRNVSTRVHSSQRESTNLMDETSNPDYDETHTHTYTRVFYIYTYICTSNLRRSMERDRIERKCKWSFDL